MTYYEIPIINKLYIIGRGTILIVKKDKFRLNDIINNRYIITGIEDFQFSNIVGLIVREMDGISN